MLQVIGLLFLTLIPFSFASTITTINTEGIQGCSINGGKIKVFFGSSSPLTPPFTIQALSGASISASAQSPVTGQVFLNQLAAGTYSVKVMDSAGNWGVRNQVQVPTFSPIVVTGNITHIQSGTISSPRKNTGAIDVTLRGGQVPQVFIWSKAPAHAGPYSQIMYVNSQGITNQPPDLTQLSEGFYKLEVFTTNNCNYVFIFEVKRLSSTVSPAVMNN